MTKGAQDYIDSVLSGKRNAGKLERLAVERHGKLLKEKAYHYDSKAAEVAILITRMLKHTSGDYYGKNFQLLGWQEFILCSLFGWKVKKTSKRLFRKAYIEVAKKNGKSELAAVLGLLGSFFDGEAGAECYSAANKYDQATICWGAARSMAQQLSAEDRDFARICKIYDSINTRQLQNLFNDSFFKPLAADSRTLDGVRPHFAIIDEFHEAKDDSILRNLASAMVNRSQPMLVIITTAGFNINGPCHRYRMTLEAILHGKSKDDTAFGIVFAADEGDDWKQKTTWQKSNPSIGQTPTWEGLESEFNKALIEGQSAEINFKTKNLNQWVRQVKTWIPDELWTANQIDADIADFAGRECFSAFDLAATRDITVIGHLFPPLEENGKFHFFASYFVPEDNAEIRSKRDRVPYLDWIAAGNLKATPGDVLDEDYVVDRMIADADRFKVQKMYYDPWQASAIALRLQNENAPVEPFRQTVTNFNEPVSWLEKAISKGILNHQNEEILRWMAGNVAMRTNSTGLKMPDKQHSREKIDGIVVLCMCIAGYLNSIAGEEQSVYNTDRFEGFLRM
jgi:phage terminase large subunit-like protein